MVTQKNNRISDQYAESASGEWQQQLERCKDTVAASVQENPLGATLMVFGIGLGVGALIGSMLADPPARRRQNLAKSLGRRMLDSMADIMPETVQQHIRS